METIYIYIHIYDGILLSHKKEQLFNPMEASNSLIPSPIILLRSHTLALQAGYQSPPLDSPPWISPPLPYLCSFHCLSLAEPQCWLHSMLCLLYACTQRAKHTKRKINQADTSHFKFMALNQSEPWMQPDDNCAGTWECLKDVGPKIKVEALMSHMKESQLHNCYSRKELISLRLSFPTVRKEWKY